MCFEVHPKTCKSICPRVEPAHIIGKRDSRIVMSSTDPSTHGDSIKQNKCDLEVNTNGLFSAGLQKDENKHPNTLKPIYFFIAYVLTFCLWFYNLILNWLYKIFIFLHSVLIIWEYFLFAFLILLNHSLSFSCWNHLFIILVNTFYEFCPLPFCCWVQHTE